MTTHVHPTHVRLLTKRPVDLPAPDAPSSARGTSAHPRAAARCHRSANLATHPKPQPPFCPSPQRPRSLLLLIPSSPFTSLQQHLASARLYRQVWYLTDRSLPINLSHSTSLASRCHEVVRNPRGELAARVRPRCRAQDASPEDPFVGTAGMSGLRSLSSVESPFLTVVRCSRASTSTLISELLARSTWDFALSLMSPRCSRHRTSPLRVATQFQ